MIASIEVDHCPESYACLIVAKNSFHCGSDRIIYSGDTRPCQNFVNYAQGSALVIHEATLGVGLEEDACRKKHTTTLEAMQLLDQIQPWRSVFTHFSGRYVKVAEVIPDHTAKKVVIAFDHMRLKLSDFEWAYMYTEIFGTLLSNDGATEEEPEPAQAPAP